MKIMHQPIVILFLLTFFSVTTSFAAVNCNTFGGQDSDDLSRRGQAAIKRVKECGARIVQISSAGPETEVSFYLVGSKVTDAEIEGLSAIPNVIWLNLGSTMITDEGLSQLRGMKLKKLHLEKTKVSDEGLRYLDDQTELEYLNLYGTEISDEGLKYLHKMKKLKRLFVWQTGVTDAGIKSLQEKIPGLQVVGECKLSEVKTEEKKAEPKKESKEDPKSETKKEDEKE